MLKFIIPKTQIALNQRSVLKILVFGLTSTLISCTASKTAISIKQGLPFYANTDAENHFSGLLVLNPISGDTIAQYHAKKYFTPASNVKIFTLYMGLKMLPPKIPSLKYLKKNDTLFVHGTGDPTLFHDAFQHHPTVDFLKSESHIALFLNNYTGKKYGPGWAWEDYDTYFSPEINGLPLYGNVVTIMQHDSLQIEPYHFRPYVLLGKRKVRRDESKNLFYVPYTTDTLKIPYITTADLTRQLVQNKVKSTISLVDHFPQGNKKTFYGIATDSLLKKMMRESDNFLAEQLALVVSSQLSDTLNFTIAKEQLLETYLNDLRQPPRWVDASGLSRYNLFTPESMVQVLQKLYLEFGKDRLFQIFPYWTAKRALKNIGKENNPPFIIAKSGSLGNNYNLSGYLVTQKGTILIFSFMNNHFMTPTSEIKKEIQSFLAAIRDAY